MTAPAVLAKKVKRVPQVAPTFRALVAYALDAEHDGAKLTSSERPEPTIIVLGAYSDKISGALAESEALSTLNRGRGNDTMHVVISLESNRSLTDAEWKAAADTVLDNLNMKGHIALLGVHRNTANEHGHLVINRVCPEPDERGRYLLRTDGGSVCSQGKDGRMRTNEVLSLHRAAAEIALNQGWPLSENGRFGPDLQLRGKADKLRLSQGSATAQALGKDSPELRTALAAQAAIGKARKASTGAGFWAKATAELADAGIAWKITEHVRKGQTVYGGKLTGEDGTNVKQSRLEDQFQIKALIKEFGPPPAANAPAKITKEDAVKAAAPILAGGKDWPALHSGLAENGMSLERKGQGAVIRFNGGKDQLKLSEIGREFTFGKLEKRLGTFQENANAPKQQTEKPARLPKSTARVELSEGRAAALYREARSSTHPTAYLALRRLTPAQIVQVGKVGERMESERRTQAAARPTPTVKPLIKDHVLPRSLAEALDEIMFEMEQLSRSQAAMRRIRAAVAAAEAAEAQARQMLAEAKTLAREAKPELNPQPENTEMFDFMKKKEPAQPAETPIPWQLYTAQKAREYAEAILEMNLGIAAQRLGEINVALGGGDSKFRIRGDADLGWCSESAYRASKLADTLEAAYAHDPGDNDPAEISEHKFWRESSEIFSSEPLPEWFRKLDAGEPLSPAEEQMHNHLIYRLNHLQDGETVAQVREQILTQQAAAEKDGPLEHIVIDGVRVPSWVGKEKEEMTPLERSEWRMGSDTASWPSWFRREGDGLALDEFEQGQKQDYHERLNAAAEALEARGLAGIDLDRHLYAAGENILAEQLSDQLQQEPDFGDGLDVSLDLCSSPDAGADPLDPMQDDALGGPRL